MTITVLLASCYREYYLVMADEDDDMGPAYLVNTVQLLLFALTIKWIIFPCPKIMAN